MASPLGFKARVGCLNRIAEANVMFPCFKKVLANSKVPQKLVGESNIIYTFYHVEIVNHATEVCKIFS